MRPASSSCRWSPPCATAPSLMPASCTWATARRRPMDRTRGCTGARWTGCASWRAACCTRARRRSATRPGLPLLRQCPTSRPAWSPQMCSQRRRNRCWVLAASPARSLDCTCSSGLPWRTRPSTCCSCRCGPLPALAPAAGPAAAGMPCTAVQARSSPLQPCSPPSSSSPLPARSPCRSAPATPPSRPSSSSPSR